MATDSSRKRAGWTVRALAPGVLAAVLSAHAQQQDGIYLNLRDVGIEHLIATMSAALGENFLVDPGVNARITVYSGRPIPRAAVREAFLSILQVHGLAAVPSGSLTKIVPAASARQFAPDLLDGDRAPGDQVVTEILQLTSVAATQLQQMIRPFLSQQALVNVHAPSNLLIVSDYAANIVRVKRLLQRVDQTVDDTPEFIPARYIAAADIARTLTTLSQGSSKDGGAVAATILADERTNTLMLSGGQAERLRLRLLISHLDVPLPRQDRTEIVYLRHEKADEMAKLLAAYLANTPYGAAGSTGRNAPRLQVSVIPYANVNALILSGPVAGLLLVRGLIDGVDVERPQILVEAVIAEISGERSAELGITWAAGARNDRPAGAVTHFGRSGAGIVDVAGAIANDQIPPIADGITLGVGTLSADGVGIAALVHALAADSSTNILSTPSVMASDGEEAQITIGQEVPFITGAFSNATGAGGVNPFQTIQRKEVGITLRIQPRIIDENTVSLRIEQEVSSLAGSSAGAADLITNKRRVATRAVARNEEILVLGGLMDESRIQGQQKVPLLGDLPLLGALFRSSGSQNMRRNLILFIRARIVADTVRSARFSATRLADFRSGAGDWLRQGLPAPAPPDRSGVDPHRVLILHEAPQPAGQTGVSEPEPIATEGEPAPPPDDPFRRGRSDQPAAEESAPIRDQLPGDAPPPDMPQPPPGF